MLMVYFNMLIRPNLQQRQHLKICILSLLTLCGQNRVYLKPNISISQDIAYQNMRISATSRQPVQGINPFNNIKLDINT